MTRKSITTLAPVNGATHSACRLPVAPTTLAEIGIDPGTWKVLVESIFPAAKTPEGVTLAVQYCRARGLDVMKRPVHVVPMWSKALNREVETVWPGIAEVQTTAARTGLWAGMDPPKFGPEKTRIFRGTVWREGRQENGQVEVTYPEWAEFTVYRLVAGTRCPFTEVVFWEETYARSGKGEMPNDMWQKRTKGQLLKCAKAAALRAAFPEEAGEYTAEEMAGKVIEADGVPVHAQVSVIDIAPVTVATSRPDPEPTQAQAQGIDQAMDAAIEEEVRQKVDKLVERSCAAGAWGRAEEYAQAHFTGAHLTYALAELAAAKQAATRTAAQTALDEAKATAKAA